MLSHTEDRAARLRAALDRHTVVLPGAINALSARPIERMGYNLVIFPVTLQRAAMHAMAAVLTEIKMSGTPAACLGEMQTRKDLYDLLGYSATVQPETGSPPNTNRRRRPSRRGRGPSQALMHIDY